MSDKKTKQPKRLRITLVHSGIGNTEKHKATLRALGFHRLNETVEHDDTPVIRGMLYKVNHLVRIEEE